MLVDEKELRQRYDAFGDETLLRMLTEERLKYRPDALAVAEEVLAQRGLSPPPEPFAPAPLPAPIEPPPHGAPNQARPKSPYGLIDFLVDMSLCGFVYWAMKKLEGWTLPWAFPWSEVIYWAALLALLGSVFSLRERWRSIKWD
ncbi:MAG: hypothetical protein ABW250_07465 [Pyrinomonadaceae bacterium]